MAYVISFFTSDDEIEQSCALESSKLTNEELSEFKFVRELKLLIGNDEHLPVSTYALPIISSWKNVMLLFLKKWAVYLPKLNELIKFVSKLDEGKYLGISLNSPMDYEERKKFLFEMQEFENGTSAISQYQDFLNQNGAFLEKYRPFAYAYSERIRFGTQERTKRVCRYCGRKMPDTTFKNDSHTISKCLGNVSFFTNDECDECNKKFGETIESEFLKYISIYRTLASRYERHPYYTTINDSYKIEIDKETNEVDFRIIDKSKAQVRIFANRASVKIDSGHIDFHKVYRALVKFVVGMLPDEELPYFEETINWVNGPQKGANHTKTFLLPIVKEAVYKEPELHPFINLFFRKDIADYEYPYLVADFHVNHLEFLYVIPGCERDKDNLNEDILEDFLKLRKDSNKWRNIKMNCPQPKHMNLNMNIFWRKNDIGIGR